MAALDWAVLIGTILILVVSFSHLYLGQLKEHRSEVSLLPQDTTTPAAFRGGSRDRWTGFIELKLVNSGEKGAYIAALDRRVVEFRKNRGTTEPKNVDLEGPRTPGLRVGDEIEPKTTRRYRPRITLEADGEFLIEHDTAVIRHTLTIEDNKGAYEISQDTVMDLHGPQHVREEFGLE